ncbi:peptidase s41 family protein [Gigaspora margarita]|uniref:Peptidase s41 family protein n=1 Tax=Gigaspora margarita TaxID=4874 RepID=A0A8H4EKI3_GIGMA|nr:peptidase s41 family protein [Gigaspora margarita]
MKSKVKLYGVLLFIILLSLNLIQYFWLDGTSHHFKREQSIAPVDTNVSVDACAKIHQGYLTVKGKNNSDIYYADYYDLETCFKTFKFNATQANKTINTIKGILENFYPFLDQDKESPQPGFTFQSIDIISKLEELLNNQYSADFQFITDLTSLLFQPKDGHLFFFSNCYNQIFTFDQGLSLYSIIKPDGKQAIKIFNDVIDSSLIDCEVVTIDSRPAMEVLTEFANDKTFSSKDLGVRFNSLLSSLSLENNNIRASSFTQQFTKSRILPEKPSISYGLTCNGSSSTIERSWKITSDFYNNFTDSNSYWNNFCAATTTPSLFDPFNDFGDYSKTYDNMISKAQMVFNGTSSRFYMQNQTGIALISTSEPTVNAQEQMKQILQGFNKLNEMGAKKIVFDLTDNGGGFISVAEFVNILLFPDTNPSFPSDAKVTNFSKLAIQTATTGQISGSIFEAQQYATFSTLQVFNTSQDFIGNNVYTHGNTQVSYTNKFIRIGYREIFRQILGNNPPKYPWTSKDMIILTNGICGSSCAMIAQHLAELQGVATIAVGGFAETPLSFASFAGGQAFNSYVLFGSLIEIGLLDNPLSPQPFDIFATLAFPIFEIYSVKNDQEVLEFAYRKADHRLFYDEKSIRDPSLLWEQASSLLN